MTPAPKGPAVLATAREVFATEVREYLERSPRQLPSKYFYDELGSALFEAICRLPWYRVTRAELALLTANARAIVEPFRPHTSLVELGCGSGEKLAVLSAGSGSPPSMVHLIDVSQAALDMASYRLHADGVHAIRTYHATYLEGLVQAAGLRADGEPFLVLFLGSNLGNFDPPIAQELLQGIRRQLRPGDGLLLGTDLVKPEHDLLLAYDDPLQVTAAFNRNLLRRINDELAGTFELAGFAHRVVWRPVEKRIEMHLVSLRHQRVVIGASGLDVVFEPGDAIWTESSHKYETTEVLERGLAAGFDAGAQWVDDVAGFALTRFTIAA